MNNLEFFSRLLPPWLQPAADRLQELVRQQRLPQALLITGQEGTGRRLLATWTAGRILELPESQLARWCAGETGEAEAGLLHPDLRVIEPPPEKHAIRVEEIRDLLEFLHLRSHQGGGRVAIIFPAERMTIAACNSLLKTLEEPPARSILMLVASAHASLPATIVSRCQRLRIPLPGAALALEWLSARDATPDWATLLEQAGGAPLGALELARTGAGAILRQLSADLDAVRRRAESPAAVARRWAAADPELLTRWLYLQATSSLTAALRSPGHGSAAAALQNASKPTTINLRMERVREAEELFRNRGRSLATDLQLTAALQRWYGDAESRG